MAVYDGCNADGAKNPQKIFCLYPLFEFKVLRRLYHNLPMASILLLISAFNFSSCLTMTTRYLKYFICSDSFPFSMVEQILINFYCFQRPIPLILVPYIVAVDIYKNKSVIQFWNLILPYPKVKSCRNIGRGC